MKRSVMSKLLLAVLALVMIVSMLPLSAMAAPVTHTVNFSDYEAFASGTKADGDFDKYGEDGYFTVFYAEDTKLDSSKKTFDDGVSGTLRMNFQGKTEGIADGEPKKAMMFKAEGAGTVKIWWVCGGDGRQIALYSDAGEILTQTEGEVIKNSMYISELSIPAAGTYYLGNPTGSNNYFQVSVTVEPAAPETPEDPDVPEHGDNTAVFAMMAMMAVCAGAVLVLNKKRAF